MTLRLDCVRLLYPDGYQDLDALADATLTGEAVTGPSESGKPTLPAVAGLSVTPGGHCADRGQGSRDRAGVPSMTCVPLRYPDGDLMTLEDAMLMADVGKVVVTGPSGCGKSALSAVAGLSVASAAGPVRIAGNNPLTALGASR